MRCTQLDDRLGAWVLLDILPKMGIHCDILLTDSEESGQSTAKYFTDTDRYNWIFEFDRAGTDVVLYEYKTDQLCELLEGYGFQIGYGSFSDICFLDPEVSAINFGVGYHRQHTRHCYARLRDTEAMVNRFAQFYSDQKDERLEHTPSYTRISDCDELCNKDELYNKHKWEYHAGNYGYTDIDKFREEWSEYQNSLV